MPKALVFVADNRRRAVDPSSVYYMKSEAGDTTVRRRGAKPLKDIRRIGEIHASWKNHGFVRIHRNHIVNPDHIHEVRIQKDGRDWEVKLAPPVNRVLPVSRAFLKDFWAAFGER